MSLITTPGDATANSYASLAEADAYVATYLGSGDWMATSVEEKEAALITATRLLDAMPQAWTGSPVDDVQALRWPRSSMFTRNGFPIATSGAASIPPDLKNATAEFARQLALTNGASLANDDVANQGIKRVKAGSVEVEFQDAQEDDDNSETFVPDNPTAASTGNMVPDLVMVMLVPSWLLATQAQTQASGSSQFLLRAV